MSGQTAWSDSLHNAGRRRSVAGGALILVAVVVLVSGAASGGWRSDVPASDHRPQLIVDDSVAADFEALALGTWDLFLAVFEARSDCFGDVYLKATYALNNRAGYDPDTATVAVRVPGTPAMLQSALLARLTASNEATSEAEKEDEYIPHSDTR